MDGWISTIIALGGLGAVSSFISSIFSWKANRRKENASATSVEIENLLKIIEILKEEISRVSSDKQKRDEKVDHLYIELRNCQSELQKQTHEIHTRDLIIQELQIRKCEIRGCNNRKPPSDF